MVSETLVFWRELKHSDRCESFIDIHNGKSYGKCLLCGHSTGVYPNNIDEHSKVIIKDKKLIKFIKGLF